MMMKSRRLIAKLVELDEAGEVIEVRITTEVFSPDALEPIVIEKTTGQLSYNSEGQLVLLKQIELEHTKITTITLP